MKGGFISIRHDEVRDTVANFLDKSCNDVKTEPGLQPLTGESISSRNQSEEARVDISARSFWQRGQRAFFDVRVFNPFAQSHLNQKLQSSFTSAEKEKKKEYNQRIIEIEYGSFTPLVFSALGGGSPETERFISELALRLEKKSDIDYSMIINYVRTKLSFSLVKSSVLCIRGSRTWKKVSNVDIDNVELFVEDATFS